MFVICVISQWMKRSKHGLFVFPQKKTLIWRRHCSIGQLCCSMTSKRSIDWFLESFRGRSFFHPSVRLPTKSHARLYPFDNPIKSLYFCSRVLFARFHFKVIRKSLCCRLEKTAEGSRRPPLHTDDVSLPGSGKCFWLAEDFPHGSTNTSRNVRSFLRLL